MDWCAWGKEEQVAGRRTILSSERERLGPEPGLRLGVAGLQWEKSDKQCTEKRVTVRNHTLRAL